jgi:drug/metabolite transporter (DMT)-like permease
LFFSLQNIGLYHTSAANAGLIQGSIPVFTLLFSVLLLGEKITFALGTCVICSVTGVSLIVLAGATPQAGSLPLLGNLLVLGSAVASCVKCALKAPERACWVEGGKAPSFCPTKQMTAALL